jgi:MarR family transcriptional regulator for hemolysin
MENEKIPLMDVGRMMRELFRVFRKRFEEKEDLETRVSIEQFSLLHAITIKEEDVIQKDMAEMMGKDKSAILRLIDSLEEKGLVRRVAAVEDRRKNYLMVTKAGYRVIDQYMKIVFGMLEEVQQGLTTEDMETFHRVVSHLKRNAEKL